jgi:glycosyltransferase involved in cell wall biosynthesis
MTGAQLQEVFPRIGAVRPADAHDERSREAVERPRLSIVVPFVGKHDDVEEVYGAYKRGVAATGETYEFVYVLDGPHPAVAAALERLRARGEPVRVLIFATAFGESAALNVGFEHARGEIILTLPAYLQIDAEDIPRLVKEVDGGADMAVGRRWPRIDAPLNRIRSRVFHGLLRALLKNPFEDLGCRARAFRRKVVDEVVLYGVRDRFMPLLATQQGFSVREVNVRQAQRERPARLNPHIYVRELIDVLAIYFLLKFTRQPLRFFGFAGLPVLLLGLLITGVVVFARLFLGVPLAERPALILGTLMIVLGIQIISVGLIGEIIIFTHARDLKTYNVEKIIE